MSSLLSNLNPEQLKAVTLARQSALVLAGAGSGKTRVLTTRIAHLLQSGQASPAGILAVTFTNKAAREMLTRLESMMPINTRGMWIGTFHGLCNRLLRAHHRDAGLPQTFQILDSQDQQSAIKRLLKALNIDDEKFKPRETGWFINAAKEQGLRAGAVEAHDEFSRRQVEIYRAYDEQCQREGVADFAELLLRSFELLSRNAPLLEHYRERFKFILVDEFQDTNKLQYRWIRLLASDNGCVFGVGDDDQSIYGFRGADTGNMRDFQRDFAIEQVIKLEQNYRSHGSILDAANAVIKHNASRLGKNLWTEAGKGEPLRIFAAANDGEEANFIVDEVKNLHREGMALTDMALLYRSNAQSRVLEHALFRAAIAYRVYGGLRFFERQEIKHALAYLRLAGNPDDDGAFSRVVNFPPRGIGARTLEQLQDTAAAGKGGGAMSLMQAARSGALAGRSAAALGAFVNVIENLRLSSVVLPLPELIDEMIDKSGLKTYYQSEREGADRLENLAELVNAAATFATEYDGEDTPLTAFLTHASLEAGEHQAGVGDDCLQLMTVHSAKGLEFRSVFMSGLEEGLFPHENSRNAQDGIEEERRLMYVAITRARERLYLSYAGIRMLHGQPRYGAVSRFVEEIPSELCKWIVLPEKTASFNVYNRGYQNDMFTPERKSNAASTRLAATDYDKSMAVRAGFETQQRDEHPFSIGQNVMHSKFGEGVVVNFEGRGGDARVQVKFRREGEKWLALQYAKLTPV